MFNPFKVSGELESSGTAMYRESNAILSHDGKYIQLCFLRFDIARSFVFFLNPSVVSFLQEKLSCVVLSSHHDCTILDNWDHVYLRHLSTEYRSILSADMSTDSRSIYRPILGRYVGRDSVDISADCRSTRMSGDTLRYFTATRPILYRHSASTTLIWSALVTEFYLLHSTVR